jgi:hypothetical protein
MRALSSTLRLMFLSAFLASRSLGATERSEQPAPACSAPQVLQDGWRSVTLKSCGIRLRLPTRYAEKHWEVTIGNPIGASYRAENFDRIDISVLPSPNAAPENNKVHRESDHRGYSECVAAIGGRKAIIQSFRGGGVIFDGERSYPPFVVVATWEAAARTHTSGREQRIKETESGGDSSSASDCAVPTVTSLCPKNA